ncbi:MAG: hypothetical protein JO171_01265 [Paludibacterium sp.]|uniref:hypothetical protein n=1 Tax=Paludibacterium sp. TaxID=1917523 RepID=UPI0025F59B05|nr:hypothetical protein [Paludibacterium sp.]MBV8045755.1 hypothetical protein [Paludibacterium sp.]MBV8648164.1 hypothetical protein [Paludibacterium sp.]
MSDQRVAVLVLSAAAAVLISGCGVFESKYIDNDRGGTYMQGERSSFTAGQITDLDTGNCWQSTTCDDNSPDVIKTSDGRRLKKIKDCHLLGKIVLTKPSDSQAYVLFRRDPSGMVGAEGSTDRFSPVMCVSPAEAGKNFSTSGGVSVGLNVKVADTPASQKMDASSAANESIVNLQGEDAASHFTNVALFHLCMAYGNGIIGASDYIANFKTVVTGAVNIAAGKDASAGSAAPAPKAKGK